MAKKDLSAADRFAVPNVYDLVEELVEKPPEAAYRRGYGDGWLGAIDAMRGLMFEDGLSSREAHDACWNHWRNALFEWYDRTSRKIKPESPAAAYRRGYRDGWAEGTEAMWDLIFTRGLRRHEGYAACQEHWRVELCEWAQGDPTKMVLPPVLQREPT